MSNRLRKNPGPSEVLRKHAVAFPLISIIAVLVLALVTGCEQGPKTGPGTIHWDRETCEHCQMVISERKHAVQIRLPDDRQTHAFDDLGCGILWLENQGLRAGGEDGPEIWIMDSKAGHWTDARESEFEAGVTTPMAYGFGLTEHGLSLAEVQAAVLEKERRRRSSTVKPSDQVRPRDAERVDVNEEARGNDVD